MNLFFTDAQTPLQETHVNGTFHFSVDATIPSPLLRRELEKHIKKLRFSDNPAITMESFVLHGMRQEAEIYSDVPPTEIL